MYNFLDPKLCPKVFCEKPATDNYEACNLISEKYNDKIRGFIAYPAIKPPVEIEFELICNVNLHYISLNTTVGSQRCSGIEILAKNHNCEYTSICRSIYDEPGIVFCNSRKYSRTAPPEHFNHNFCLRFFKSNTFSCFLNATKVKIIIFRTNKSVPCLGAVEIWGIPSKSCSEVTVQTINHLMTKPTNTLVTTSTTEEFRIPDDFKDDLTYEIMTLPMTLPSGKTIDQSTLDKHLKSEISFGRRPCDPFTGLKFSNVLKPILNVGLKSRIDMFLLQNSHRPEFNNLNRTVGRINRNNSVNVNKRKNNCEGTELEDAITRAKCSPGFINFSEICERNMCIKCKSKFDTLYEVPCQHLYCRKCLLIIHQSLRCLECDNSFVNSDVKKRYL